MTVNTVYMDRQYSDDYDYYIGGALYSRNPSNTVVPYGYVFKTVEDIYNY